MFKIQKNQKKNFDLLHSANINLIIVIYKYWVTTNDLKKFNTLKINKLKIV